LKPINPTVFIKKLISFVTDQGSPATDSRTDELLEQNEQLKRQNLELAGQFQISQERLAVRHDEVATQRRQIVALRCEKQQLAHLVRRKRKRCPHEGGTLRVASDAAVKEARQLKKSNEHLSRELSKRDELVAGLKSQLQDLRATVEASREQAEGAAARISRLEGMLARKAKALKQAESRIRLAEREAEKHLEHSAELRSERDRLEQDLKAVRADLDVLQAQISRQDRETDSLRKAHGQLMEQHRRLQADYQVLEQDAVSAAEEDEHEIAALKARIEELSERHAFRVYAETSAKHR
jgi:hypothetical protein